MTTMELNAMRGELARDILNIESMEVLKKIRRYLNRLLKAEQENMSKRKESLIPIE